MAGWRMVGRSREFAQLTVAVAAGRGAVITGPAGVGKTTLALSGVEWAEQRGMAYRRASATRAAQGLPFGAFASLLPAERSDADRSREDLGVLLGRYARAMVDRPTGVRCWSSSTMHISWITGRPSWCSSWL